jgi:hypothetical protein
VGIDSGRHDGVREGEIAMTRMPDEGDPSYARWSAAIRGEIADLDDMRVHVFHGLQDQTAPPAHAGLRPACAAR